MRPFGKTIALEEARAIADYVVLDTAPLGEVSDALTIADQVDDVIVVARPGHTNRMNLQTVRDLLDGAGVQPTGLLLIGQQQGRTSSYYTYDGMPRDRKPQRTSLARSR